MTKLDAVTAPIKRHMVDKILPSKDYVGGIIMPNEDIIACVTLQTIDIKGDYGNPYKAVVKYSQDGVIEKIPTK